jgi:hypothetical protein
MGVTGSKLEGDKSQLASLKKIQTNMGKIKLTDKDNSDTFTSAKTSIDELVKNIETKPAASETNASASGTNASASGTNASASERNPADSETNPAASETNSDGKETKPVLPSEGLDSSSSKGGKRKSRRRRRSKQHHKSTRTLRLI